jgi:hypothetical protein
MHKFDAHRAVGLMARYPRHKWNLKVGQMMWLQAHVDQCHECKDRIDDLLAKHPRIGPTQEQN